MGYTYVAKSINGKRIDEHRMLMEAYLGRKLSRYEVVHHINGVKNDNRIDNLLMMSLSEHSRMHMLGNTPSDKTEEGLKSLREAGKAHAIHLQKKVAQYTKSGTIVRVYDCIRDVDKFGFNNTHVSECCNKKRWTHKGYVWKFA